MRDSFPFLTFHSNTEFLREKSYNSIRILFVTPNRSLIVHTCRCVRWTPDLTPKPPCFLWTVLSSQNKCAFRKEQVIALSHSIEQESVVVGCAPPACCPVNGQTPLKTLLLGNFVCGRQQYNSKKGM